MTTIRTFLLGRRVSSLRWPLGGAAVVAAIAHVPVIGPHLDEAPYMGVLFVVLTVACVGLAGAVIVYDTAAVYAACAITCGLAVVGYVATRLLAFPMLADDVGNWLEPLGVVSIVSETVVVALSVLAMRQRVTTRASGGVTTNGDHPTRRIWSRHAPRR